MVFHLYHYHILRLGQLVCDIVVITGQMFEDAVILVVDRDGKMVVDWLEYHECRYIQCSFSFLYHLDVLPTVTLFRGSESVAGSSEIMEYALLFVASLVVSVGGRSPDDTDHASILLAISTYLQR